MDLDTETAADTSHRSRTHRRSAQRARKPHKRPLCRTWQGKRFLVSIHANAAGNGSKWMNALGWSCYTSKGDTAADVLATCPAVLVENFFYDNPDDLRFLESEEGKELVTKVIAERVMSFLTEDMNSGII